MKKFKLTILIIFFRILNFILKLTGRGSGTALPGLIAEKHFPWVKQELLSQLKNNIAITGTNGKTTTQSILTSIFQASGKKVFNNKAGSNMNRGIISELLKRADLNGKLDFDIGIFELEEATFPKIIEEIRPKIIIITNLFRDQLDAYGEIDKTQQYIVDGINKIPEAKVILNFDDPKVREIQDKIKHEVFFVHLEDEVISQIKYEDTKQETQIPDKHILIGQNCKVDEKLTNLFDATLIENNSRTLFKGLILKTPGKFQISNALGAIAAARIAGIDINAIRKGLENFTPAFGRGEELKIKRSGKDLSFHVLLVKNPAGCSLNLDLIKDIPNLNLMLILNDNTADGKDVSWIWDSNFEVLNSADIKSIVIAGKRAEDMHVRIKYALLNRKYTNIKIEVENDIKKAINIAAKSAQKDIYVLPTYTGMLEFRKTLGFKLD